MNRLRRSPLFVIVLALWLGIGAAFTAALAADMSGTMAMADAAGATSEPCTACGSGDGDAVVVDCLPFCHMASSMVLPSGLTLQDVHPLAFVAGAVASPDGFIDGFDPSPPKASIHS